MQINKLNVSGKAAWRMAQRNLDPDDVQLALQAGQKLHRTGAEFYFLGKRDMPDDKEFERLNGTIIIVQNKTIITVYRNRRGLHTIKRKLKLNKRKNRRTIFGIHQKYCPFHPVEYGCNCADDLSMAINP